ncbi:S1 RNA-binding domain-containing protein, partial [Aliarcobacter butzleri]
LLKLKDIVNELLKTGYDVRTEFKKVKFANDILDKNDLKEGYLLSGRVRNIIDFGAIVDIGLKKDSLLHITQISEKSILHP